MGATQNVKLTVWVGSYGLGVFFCCCMINIFTLTSEFHCDSCRLQGLGDREGLEEIVILTFFVAS